MRDPHRWRPNSIGRGSQRDDGNVDDEPTPAPANLSTLRGEHVELFTCETTFERELTIPGTLQMLEAAAREVGSRRVANQLQVLRRELEDGGQPDLNLAKDQVLR